jgi:putative ABC transport system ATP-binding protein
MSIAVHCKNVKKSYGEGASRVEALRGVDLEVRQGELLMMMGPSGSGKTTLISVIAGILKQDEGECLISGLDLNHMQDQEKTRYRGRHVGFVFQSFNLIPMLSCEENVAVPLLLKGEDRKSALQKARQLLADVGIAEKAEISPSQISGGQQQRVAIARSMIHDPDLIVCDEPTSHLDHDTGKNVMDLLRSIVGKGGKTLIVVTHDVRITPFADRIVHLEDGVIVDQNL